VKTTQDLIIHIRSAISGIYEEPEASAIAFALAGHVLGLTRLELSMQRHDLITHENEEKTDALIARLLNHEPLQYITGEAHFYGLDLKVNSSVLIPRPETEELVSKIIKENQHTEHLKILDVGTGSGCIAIALAEFLTCSKVYGIDISEKALEVAHANALKYGQPVEWIEADIFGEKKLPVALHSLDLVVSNPPYVLENEKPRMRRNVLEHEPHLALFVPDEEALLYYRRIAMVASRLLKPGGRLYFEINEQFAGATVEMLQELHFENPQASKDIFDKDRFVTAVWPGKSTKKS
jgi:release factor glutamine methyltransferase